MGEQDAVEAVVFSRALERAIRMVPNKPRADILTSDLVEGIVAAAERGLREERELALMALQHFGIVPR
jgi:uncharacterized protein with ACT and thioredoxin-like domain